MIYQRPRGTRDILPQEAARMRWLEAGCRSLFESYGFEEIRTPTFESTELFLRSIGESSEIVSKEMYTFKDKTGRSLSLRPEGTAGVVRAVLQAGLTLPCRLYYILPMFRYERPQKGRYREHYQVGVELFGEASPLADAELIELAVRVARLAGVDPLSLEVNSVGCKGCRGRFIPRLLDHLEKYREGICPDCQTRLKRNPLRVFDCKHPDCRRVYLGAPKPVDHLAHECRAHFDGVLRYLEELGVEYRLNPGLVRGLDYYTRTVFELKAEPFGPQDTVVGGGRYDDLVAEFGGPPTPALGFGAGLERLLLAGGGPSSPGPPRVFVVAVGSEAVSAAIRVLRELRSANIPSLMDYDERRLKPQLRRANRFHARYAVIIGLDELSSGRYSLKDLETGVQREVEPRSLIDAIR